MKRATSSVVALAACMAASAASASLLFPVDGDWHSVKTLCPETDTPVLAVSSVTVSNPNARPTFVAARIVDSYDYITIRGGGRNVGRDIGHHEPLRAIGYIDPPDGVQTCYTLQIRSGASPRPDLSKRLKVDEKSIGFFFVHAEAVPTH